MPQLAIERYDFPAKRTGVIVGKYHGARAVGHSLVISTRGALGRSLVGDLQHQAIAVAGFGIRICGPQLFGTMGVIESKCRSNA